MSSETFTKLVESLTQKVKEPTCERDSIEDEVFAIVRGGIKISDEQASFLLQKLVVTYEEYHI